MMVGPRREDWPRLVLHPMVAAAGVYAFVDPPPSIVDAAAQWVALTWAACLLAGGVLSTWAVLSGYLLPHVAGLGLEAVGLTVFATAVYAAGGRQTVSGVLVIMAFVIGLLDGGLRVFRRNTWRRRADL